MAKYSANTIQSINDTTTTYQNSTITQNHNQNNNHYHFPSTTAAAPTNQSCVEAFRLWEESAEQHDDQLLINILLHIAAKNDGKLTKQYSSACSLFEELVAKKKNKFKFFRKVKAAYLEKKKAAAQQKTQHIDDDDDVKQNEETCEKAKENEHETKEIPSNVKHSTSDPNRYRASPSCRYKDGVCDKNKLLYDINNERMDCDDALPQHKEAIDVSLNYATNPLFGDLNEQQTETPHASYNDPLFSTPHKGKANPFDSAQHAVTFNRNNKHNQDDNGLTLDGIKNKLLNDINNGRMDCDDALPQHKETIGVPLNHVTNPSVNKLAPLNDDEISQIPHELVLNEKHPPTTVFDDKSSVQNEDNIAWDGDDNELDEYLIPKWPQTDLKTEVPQLFNFEIEESNKKYPDIENDVIRWCMMDTDDDDDDDDWGIFHLHKR